MNDQPITPQPDEQLILPTEPAPELPWVPQIRVTFGPDNLLPEKLTNPRFVGWVHHLNGGWYARVECYSDLDGVYQWVGALYPTSDDVTPTGWLSAIAGYLWAENAIQRLTAAVKEGRDYRTWAGFTGLASYSVRIDIPTEP